MNSVPKIDLFEARSLEEVPDLLEGWKMNNLQIDPGRASCFVRTVTMGDLVVTRTSESHGSVANYAIQKDTTVFHFTNPCNQPTNWCGLELPHNMMLINPSGRDYVTAQRGSFDVMSIQVSNDLLVAEQMLPDNYIAPGDISNRWMVPLGGTGRQFRSWLFDAFGDVNKMTTTFSTAEFASEFKDVILQCLGDILGNELQTHCTKPERLHRRLDLAKQAQGLITDQVSEIRSVGRIANELNISPRALRNLFRDVFQTSPYQYLLSYRLQCTRRDLIRNSTHNLVNSATISRIATKYGFEELGRFSQYYRRMFGELPSATLKRRE